MGDTRTISSAVMEHSTAIDEARVSERAAATYFRTFWDSYKGHVRGILVGIAIDGLVGAGIGVALSFLPALAGMGLAVTGVCAGVGAIFGTDTFGQIGGAAASRASALAEKHARMLDPAHEGDTLKALDDKLMVDGRGHHYEYPPTRDKGKIFSWKSGTVGVLVGVTIGLLAASTGLLGASPLIGGLLTAKLTAAVVCGLFGLTFGIERSVFKTIFNQTDANVRGKLTFGHSGPDLGRAQVAGKENSGELYQHRLRRQEEINLLQKQYYDKIFWGGISGTFRGFAGGLVGGALVGAAIGVLAFAILSLAAPAALLSLLPAGALSILPALPVLIAGFTAAGAMLGMRIFDPTGMEAGCEATARAIDDEFERNRTLQQKGVTPMPAKKLEMPLFNPKTILIMGAVGAAGGFALAAALSVGILSGMPLYVPTLIGALTGTTFGVGLPFWKGIGKVTDRIYGTSYFRQGDPKPDRTLVIEKSPQTALRPTRETPVTPEEAASLDAKLDKTHDKSFGQTILSNQNMAPIMPTIG